jgi:hypothetical protein
LGSATTATPPAAALVRLRGGAAGAVGLLRPLAALAGSAFADAFSDAVAA